jgi:hypothetical protein
MQPPCERKIVQARFNGKGQRPFQRVYNKPIDQRIFVPHIDILV